MKTHADVDNYIKSLGVDPGLSKTELRKALVKVVGEKGYKEIGDVSRGIDAPINTPIKTLDRPPTPAPASDQESLYRKKLGPYLGEAFEQASSFGRGGGNVMVNLANVLNRGVGAPDIPQYERQPWEGPAHPVAHALGSVATAVPVMGMGGLAAPESLSPGAIPALSRFAGSGAFGASQSPEHRGLGFAEGVAAQGVGEGVSKVIQPLTKKYIRNKLLSYALGKSDELRNKVGDLSVRGPEQVAALREGVEDFPTSLGAATNIPVIKDLEKALRATPFSGIKKKLAPGIHATKQKASNIIDKMLEGLGETGEVSELSKHVSGAVKNSASDIKNSFRREYNTISDIADAKGYSHSEKPNFIKEAKKYLGKGEREVDEGVISPPGISDLSQRDATFLKENISPSSISSLKNNPRTLQQMRDHESALKRKGRLATNPETKKMWNNLAEATRKDYEHNAGLSKSPNLKSKIEDINKRYKEQYIEPYENEKQIQEIISERHDTPSSELVKAKHAKVLGNLDQKTKGLVYFDKALKNKVSLNPETGQYDISPEALSRVFGKIGAPESKIKETLLNPEVRKELKQLQKMNILGAPQRLDSMEVPTGKSLASILKLGGVLAALHSIYPPLIAGGLGAGRGLSKMLTDPKMLEAFSKREIPKLAPKRMKAIPVMGAISGSRDKKRKKR